MCRASGPVLMLRAGMDNKRHSIINAVCGQQKGQSRAKSHVRRTLQKKKKKKKICNVTDSVSSRQFREFRDFSAIAENHWPY